MGFTWTVAQAISFLETFTLNIDIILPLLKQTLHIFSKSSSIFTQYHTNFGQNSNQLGQHNLQIDNNINNLKQQQMNCHIRMR